MPTWITYAMQTLKKNMPQETSRYQPTLVGKMFIKIPSWHLRQNIHFGCMFIELLTKPTAEYVIDATGPDVIFRAAKHELAKDYVHQLPSKYYYMCDKESTDTCYAHSHTGAWKTNRDKEIDR